MKRGEVYYADLNPVFGSEQGGKRPVLIISNNTGNKYSPTVIVACITSEQKKDLPTHVKFYGRNMKFKSTILLEQIRTIDKSRIDSYICRVPDREMKNVDEALKISLDTLEEKGRDNMNELKIFTNEEFGQVRTVTIENEPWFVGKDVAEALGYSNTKDALINHVTEEDKRILQRSEIATIENHLPKEVFPINFTSGNVPNRGLTIINESGLYALIFGSKLESAKRFKHWVTSDVLPSIRRSGAYQMKRMTPEEMMRVQLGMIDDVSDRVTKLENTMNIDYGQQRVLEKEVAAVVISSLGGKDSNAYHEISKKVFAECNRDVKDYFHVNSRNNIPRLRFEDAVEYIRNWTPCSNTRMEIKESNAQMRI